MPVDGGAGVCGLQAHCHVVYCCRSCMHVAYSRRGSTREARRRAFGIVHEHTADLFEAMPRCLLDRMQHAPQGSSAIPKGEAYTYQMLPRQLQTCLILLAWDGVLCSWRSRH